MKNGITPDFVSRLVGKWKLATPTNIQAETVM